MRILYVFITFLSISELTATIYNVATQSQFDSAVTSSGASAQNNTINVDVPSPGVSISTPTIFSGNAPNTLAINVNGVDPSGVTPFVLQSPLTLNAQGTISLVPGTSSVEMDVNSTLTQTGGSVSATNGSRVVVGSGGTYALNGGTLQVGGANGLSSIGGGAFTLAGATKTLQVVGSDLSIDMEMDMTGTGQAFLDTNGLNATVSGLLTTPVSPTGLPSFNKIGLGNLDLSNFTMSGGGEYHVEQGTVTVSGTTTIPYFAVGSGAGASANMTLSDSSMVLTIQQTVPGNESPTLQIGDFSGLCTVNQTAGIINTRDASFNISNQTGQGVYNLSGGTISSMVGLLTIGRNSGTHPPSTGILNISGTGLFDISGGGTFLILGSRLGTAAGVGHSSGELNQTGGIIRFSNGAEMFLSSFGNGVYNLTGGVLEIGATALNANFAGGGTYQFNFGNGTVQMIGSDLTTMVNMNLIPGQNGTVDTNALNASLLGQISGGGGLIKIGAGILSFSGANSYSGTTTVNGGTFQALASDTFSPNSSIILANATGALLDLNNNSQVIPSLSGGGASGGDVLLGTATLTLGGDNSSTTFAGGISGAGSLIKQGSGTFTVTGTNNYGGGTFINAGTLEGQSNSLQGSIAVNNNTLTFNQPFDGTFNGSITGSGSATLNKIGAGSLSLVTDNSGFLGLSSTSEGRLILNNLLGGNATVFQTGILSGSGTVLGNVTVNNGGTLDPGSLGTFHIGGNYIQGSSGTTIAQISGSGQSTLVDIIGSATLAGALQVDSVDGVINPSFTYDILHANGGVTGTFSRVTTNNPVLVPRITYLPDDVLLNLGTNFSVVALTKNQKEVSLQLNKIINPTAAEQALLTELINLSSDPSTESLVRLALDELSGQQYTDALMIAEFSNHQVARRLYEALRLNLTSSSSCCRDACEEWTLWLSAGGGGSNFSGNKEARGFQMKGYEISGGLQRQIRGAWTLGIAGSFDEEKVHYKLKGTSKNTIGYGALYLGYRPESFYVWGDLSFGCDEQKIERFVDVGTLHFSAHSKPRIYLGSAYVEAGFDCFMKTLLIQPFLGFELGYFHENAVSENGALPVNLNIASKSLTSGYSNLGLHLTAADWLESFRFGLDVSWQCRLTPFDDNISVLFQSFGDSFPILGAPLNRNSVKGALTATHSFSCGFESFVEANGEKWSEASTYNFIAGVSYSW